MNKREYCYALNRLGYGSGPSLLTNDEELELRETIRDQDALIKLLMDEAAGVDVDKFLALMEQINDNLWLGNTFGSPAWFAGVDEIPY